MATPSATDVQAATSAWEPDQVGLLRKLLQNVADSPQEPKFRRLKLTNARIAALIEKAPQARQFLETIGWVSADEGSALEFPVSAPLEPLANLLAALPMLASPSKGPKWVLTPGAEVWPMTVMRGPLKVKLELPAAAPLEALEEAVELNSNLGVPRGRQRLLCGYPPRPIEAKRQDGSIPSLKDLGLKAVLLEDVWEEMVVSLREGRMTFAELTGALASPTIAAIALREMRGFVTENARKRLRASSLRMPVTEVRAARTLFRDLWPPGNASTHQERLDFCIECTDAPSKRQRSGAGAGDARTFAELMAAVQAEDDEDSDDEPIERREIVVDRQTIFESIISQVSSATPGELRQPLEVRFKDEAAEDAGGPRREFFNEFGRAVADAVGLWQKTPIGSLVPTPAPVSTQQVPDQIARLGNYRHCGRVYGMALHHSAQPPQQPLLMGLPLARSFLRVVQGDDIATVEELQLELNAEQHENSRDVRGTASFRTSSLAELGLEGQLTFSYQVPDSDLVDLVPEGRSKVVTDESKDEWLRLTLRYMLVESVQEAADAFRLGVCEVLGGAHLVLLSPLELSKLWWGVGEISDANLAMWRSQTEISPVRKQEAKWFFELLEGDLRGSRAQVLKFSTGSDRWPTDSSNFRFAIEPMDGGDEAMPIGMTCGNMLKLARYSGPEPLRRQLLKAVDWGMDMQVT